ncbi:MAG: AtpZ/AtpI family protein [Fusobacterium sp.]|uniref:AtpZ/AtpI family protein n=1 Tax=Fusobacterium sp. TaxID=68766 RepID=UPI0026DD6113|nr:AtpZ/AtpI family protein [Fusobacterium sp.]MDO4690495.1 AtpZ/AtpI family protein [Fusobacterium sp.]
MKLNNFFNSDAIRYLTLLGNIGFTIFINIFISIYLYKFFEKYFFQSLIVFILFLFLGIANAFYSIYKTIMGKK